MDIQTKVYNILQTIPSESSTLDYKLIPYKLDKQGDALKDIVAFLNSSEAIGQDKFLMFGIDEQERNRIGLKYSMMDDASLQNLIDKIEPRPKIASGEVTYQDKQFGYIFISKENENRPYFIKESYGKDKAGVHAGQAFIRKGSKNYSITRFDLDDIYQYGKINVAIYNNFISVNPIAEKNHSKKEIHYTYGTIDISIRNHTMLPISFTGGGVEIYDDKNQLRTRGYISGIGKLLNVVDYPYKLEAKDEDTLPIYFDFTSDDCLRLEVNQEGFTDILTSAKVILRTLDCGMYETDTELCTFRAFGDVLHKVKYSNNGWNFRSKR